MDTIKIYIREFIAKLLTVKSTEQLQNHSLKSSPFHQLFENGSVLHTARGWKSWQDKDTFSKPGNSLIKKMS